MAAFVSGIKFVISWIFYSLINMDCCLYLSACIINLFRKQHWKINLGISILNQSTFILQFQWFNVACVISHVLQKIDLLKYENHSTK